MARRDDFQYREFGVLVRNERISAVHVANGLIQVLRAVGPNARLGSEIMSEYPDEFEGEVTALLDQRFPSGWKLTPEALAVSLVSTKEGPFSVVGDSPPPGRATLTEREYARRSEVLVAGRSHLQKTFGDRIRDLTPAHQAAIASVLNADGRVAIAGASSPTTPGVAFAGYDTNYTFSLLHAATFLGLLARTVAGQTALAQLRKEVLKEGAHARFVELLGLQQTPQDSQPEHGLTLPSPAGPRWEEQAMNVAGLVTRLLAWSHLEGGAASPGQLLMSLVDLVGVFFSSSMLRWTHVEAGTSGPLWGPKLLVVSPARADSRDHAGIAAAQRSIVTASARLLNNIIQDEAFLTPRGKGAKDFWLPTGAALALGAATGWVLPRDARGGAKRYFSPGPRQLTTLVRALVSPHEDLSWSQLHERASDQLGLWLGGHHDEQSAMLNVSANHITLARVGAVNQGHMIALGLARQESDNVVRVHGGAL